MSSAWNSEPCQICQAISIFQLNRAIRRLFQHSNSLWNQGNQTITESNRQHFGWPGWPCWQRPMNWSWFSSFDKPHQVPWSTKSSGCELCWTACQARSVMCEECTKSVDNLGLKSCQVALGCLDSVEAHAVSWRGTTLQRDLRSLTIWCKPSNWS